MSRLITPKCKLCRLEGVKLYLKGERCYTDKCAVVRKPYPPGRTASYSARRSIYGVGLREKQKVKRIYGLTETQLKNVYDKASSEKGDKGLKFLQRLEMRLDNIVFLLGLAPSRPAARQLVTHGHVLVNEKKLSIPSYPVSIGQTVRIKTDSLATTRAPGLKTPTWLKSLPKGGEVISEPSRDMIDEGIRENLIIEFYSR